VRRQRVAVVGGGAKAAALAAKACCLHRTGAEVDVTIFEKDVIGAAWDGHHGYTDGMQRLCTLAERDLGFPYEPELVDGVSALMQSEFSWSAWQIDGMNYSDWINRGRKPPTHRDYADYLRYAVEKSGAQVLYGRVTGLRVKNDRWTVSRVDRDTKVEISASDFDGVVVTGPGPSARRFPRLADPRVFTGQSFWARHVAVRRALKRAKLPIVIIGGGGTAAAIAAWFVRLGLDKSELLLLTNRATLFTRTTNFFEDRIFDDEATWASLSDDDRRGFTTRLNRGVVWESVTELLSDEPRLRLVPGKATAVKLGTRRRGAHLADLVVSYRNHLGDVDLPADLVVDASGFDDWWFRKLLPYALRTEFEDPDRATDHERTMAPDLSFNLPGWPRLHAPMHSQIVGPGFMSLMVLGATADRILNPYVRTAMPGARPSTHSLSGSAGR
jgi:mycobactin lysine-N-oxygenase